MIERALRYGSAVLVIALAAPPAAALSGISASVLSLFGGLLLVLAAISGAQSALRRQPLGARITTAIYGGLVFGLGLFVDPRPIAVLLAYLVGLLGMNVVLYHSATYGPALAAIRGEDETARRTQTAALRSLGISGAALAISYGGSLALLPLFAVDIGLREPASALLFALGILVLLFFLALPPETWSTRWGRRG